MSRKINFQANIVNNFLQNDEYMALADYLRDLFEIKRDGKGIPIKFEFCAAILDSLQQILRIVAQFNELHNENVLLIETLRSLRNYTSNEAAQNYLLNDDSLSLVKDVFSKLYNKKDLSLRILVQFLINLVVSNGCASIRVYELFHPEILNCLKEHVHIYENSALLYNLTLYKPISEPEVIETVLTLYRNIYDVEFLQYLVEKIVESQIFWSYYDSFLTQHKIIALEVVKHSKESKFVLGKNTFLFLIEKLINSSKIIFQTETGCTDDLEPYESSLILEIISSLSSDHNYLPLLQSNKDVLITAGILLINIHRLGKSSQNCFTSIQKLSEVREPNEKIRDHPAFGFKADLVRLIGNLCWKNKTIQNLAREAEIIPVLLDCCNIDARNPFIIQWAIFAIHNLCDGNAENQNIISAMHREGTVSSSVLEEIGMTLHSDGENALKIVPLDSLRK